MRVTTAAAVANIIHNYHAMLKFGYILRIVCTALSVKVEGGGGMVNPCTKWSRGRVTEGNKTNDHKSMVNDVEGFTFT